MGCTSSITTARRVKRIRHPNIQINVIEPSTGLSDTTSSSVTSVPPPSKYNVSSDAAPFAMRCRSAFGRLPDTSPAVGQRCRRASDWEATRSVGHWSRSTVTAWESETDSKAEEKATGIGSHRPSDQTEKIHPPPAVSST